MSAFKSECIKLWNGEKVWIVMKTDYLRLGAIGGKCISNCTDWIFAGVLLSGFRWCFALPPKKNSVVAQGIPVSFYSAAVDCRSSHLNHDCLGGFISWMSAVKAREPPFSCIFLSGCCASCCIFFLSALVFCMKRSTRSKEHLLPLK